MLESPPPVRQLPTLVLESPPAVRQLPALVHAVASEVDAFSSRRRQVEELRAVLPARRSHLWHDPAVCDVGLQLELNTGTERHAPRVRVELSMRYAAGATLPRQCRVSEARQLEDEDREELVQLTDTFLRLPLPDAFREAFQ